MRRIAPYGEWESAISADVVTRALVRFSDILQVDDRDVYWVESRPHEGGRSAIVRRTSTGVVEDVGPSEFDARTRVHEYGGAAYAVRDGVVFASSFEDQRIHRFADQGQARPITPAAPTRAGYRYADLDLADGWGVAVREDHTRTGEPANELVRVDLEGAEPPRVIATGRDFYSAPRISPDRSTLAWLEWDHPDMPWDATELRVARIGSDGLAGSELMAGGDDESIVQPEWSPDGRLHWVSDRSGWWNLYRDGVPLLEMEAEFGEPLWNFGMRRYGFGADGAIVASCVTTSDDRLVVLEDGRARWLDLPFASLGVSIAVQGSHAYVVAGAPDRPTGVMDIDVVSGSWQQVTANPATIDPEWVSRPETIEYDTPDGPAFARYYPPANPHFRGPEGSAPPLVVRIHGGPTSQAHRSMRPDRLFWTSRGFGLVDVDYGGSSGYGREYRNRLRGSWGVVDVRDCALAAAHLASCGKADPDALLISGGSAGGFTALLSLATRDEYAGGTSTYGISDLRALAEHTHKFESRYVDRLVGPLPNAAQTYDDRSPLSHIDSFESPVLLLQGTEDAVVPPEQTRAIQSSLIEHGTPVACELFEGEGHGFRQAANQVRALESELSFYAQVLGLRAPDHIDPVKIVGLQPRGRASDRP